MATKVRGKKSGKVYLLLGVGYGAYQSMAMRNTFDALSPTIERCEFAMVAECDRDGQIDWIDHRKLE